jgi:hypothetical protein
MRRFLANSRRILPATVALLRNIIMVEFIVTSKSKRLMFLPIGLSDCGYQPAAATMLGRWVGSGKRVRAVTEPLGVTVSPWLF